jgi:steroid 5-alpha reductase family enzyme
VRARSFTYVAFVYAIALAAAFAIAQSQPTVEPLIRLALADFAATVVVFVSSRRANNSSVYDPYWSVIPIALVAWLASGIELQTRGIVALVAVVLWGVRLTWNWARSWRGLEHEDWRYVDIRARTAALYWPASFFGIHLLPTVLTFLGCMPLLPALRFPLPWSALDALATAITFGAIACEWIADEQLRAFRRAHPSGTCEVGLWRFSRHPNYFGEISFWVGLCLFGLAAGGPLWLVLGPLAMIALFVFASIPLAEKRALLRRPEYARHIESVSMLIPWFPKQRP